MEPLSLAFEINQFSQDIYEKNAYSPYPDHPLLSHHAKTTLLLQEAQSRYFNGDIHANFKSEFEAKSIPLLKTMNAPIGLIELIPSIILKDDQSGSPKLTSAFIKSIKHYQRKHPQMALSQLLTYFFEHEAYLPAKAVSSKLKALNDQYKVMHNKSIEETIANYNQSTEANDEQAFGEVCQTIKMLSWQMTLATTINYFQKAPVNQLFDIDAIYHWFKAFDQNFQKSMLEYPNSAVLDNMVNALIGEIRQGNEASQNLHPLLLQLWHQNLNVDQDTPSIIRGHYETSQEGLSHFIHKITQLPIALIRKQVQKFDTLNTNPIYARSADTTYSTQSHHCLKDYKLHFNNIKENIQSFLLDDLGLFKAHTFLGGLEENLNKLASFDKQQLGNWLKKQLHAHLTDFADHYESLVSNSANQGQMYDGHLNYHWVTQFYWMLLDQCKSNPSRETNQLFYKMITDCLVATGNHYKCFKGVYEDAMTATPMLYQAFNDTDQQKSNQLTEHYTQIANHLFEDTVSLHVNGMINADLFHWWQASKNHTERLTDTEYQQALASNPHLFKALSETEKRTLFNIRYAFVKDLFKHTCLNIDTCYAIADHMNLVYYCQKKDEEPDTLWALIMQNACYSDETDITRVHDALFKHIDARLASIDKLFFQILIDCDEDNMPVITSDISLGLFKKHDIEIFSFRKELTEKKVKLMLAIDPTSFSKLPLGQIKYEQYPDLVKWVNPIIPYLPYDLSLKAYWWMIETLDAKTFNIYKIKDSLFENVEFNMDLFLNIICLDLPLITRFSKNRVILDEYVHPIFDCFNRLVKTLNIQNLDACHEYITSIIGNQWHRNEDWANLYFNWMTYYKNANPKQKNQLIKRYFEHDSFRNLLTCSNDVQAMKLIQMCPDRFIDIIDHFLDGLPSDLPANFVKENSLLKWVIFYHHGSRPEINESHYKIRWLYFMHRLKGKTDLDPIRQSIHDAMIESMNKEIKRFNGWVGTFESIFHNGLQPHQYLQRWLYYLAVEPRNTYYISNRELKANHKQLLKQNNAFLKKWIPYADINLDKVVFKNEVLQELIDSFEQAYQANTDDLSDYERNHLLEQIHTLTNWHTMATCNIS